MDDLKFLDRPIRVWKPMHEGGQFISRISNFNMTFFADSAIRAKRAASDFRLIEMEKLHKKLPEEYQDALAAAKERAKS